MAQLKLNVFFAFFPYGGNGSVSSEHPSIRDWFAKTVIKAKSDPRVGEVSSKDFSDTPITMTRNLAVKTARENGADVLIMIDSDQHIDFHLKDDAFARPFWDTSFDFLYKHWQHGPIVIGSPYCGPPPIENVYAFRWANYQSDHPNLDMRLEAYSREEAALLSGIQEAAAIPTGVVMFDIRVFELVKPPYFYYEYTDEFETQKASTEDVTATRDICLQGFALLGYNPVFINWDSWAGHYKPKCVGKPTALTTEQVSKKYREPTRPAAERLVMVGEGQHGKQVPHIARNGDH